MNSGDIPLLHCSHAIEEGCEEHRDVTLDPPVLSHHGAPAARVFVTSSAFGLVKEAPRRLLSLGDPGSLRTQFRS